MARPPPACRSRKRISEFRILIDRAFQNTLLSYRHFWKVFSANMMFSFQFWCFLLLNGVSGFQRDAACSLAQAPSHQAKNFVMAPNTGISSALELSNFPYSIGRACPRKTSLVTLQSSEIVDMNGSFKTKMNGALGSFGQSLASVQFPNAIVAAGERLSNVWRRSWFALPMILAVFPVYCAIFKGTCATMPHWWQVVNMECIRRSKDAGVVIAGFLCSNIAYFISGGFLLNRFPFQAWKRGIQRPTRFTMLGLWILTAGLISTVFHSVQALGSYSVAESLCYIDHGVAISASFYFLDTCGLPSKRVLALGLAGLAALAFTYPSYAFLHSSWHFLSAAAATKWAIEGHARTLTN